MRNKALRLGRQFRYIAAHQGFPEAVRLTFAFIMRHLDRLGRRGRPRLAEFPTGASCEKTENFFDGARRGIKTPLKNRHTATDGRYHLLYGGDVEFSGHITVVVAHNDSHGAVAPYLTHLCAHFKTLGWKVVLSSSKELRGHAAPWDWADAAICGTYNGSAAASWKIALSVIPSLADCSQLVLCSGKIFGPLGSFTAMHKRMGKIPCDFWGLSVIPLPFPHLQPDYLVFYPKALRHPAFTDFFENVPLDSDTGNMEAALSPDLAGHGLKAGAFCLPRNRSAAYFPTPAGRWKALLKAGSPLLGHEPLLVRHDNPGPSWAYELSARGYPTELAEQYFRDNGLDYSAAHSVGRVYGTFPPDVGVLQRPADLPRYSGVSCPDASLSAVVHCYYPQILPELGKYIDNLPRRAALYVSTDSQEKARRISAFFEPFEFSKLEVRVFPNKGWDMAPFFAGFKDVLPRYEFALKLHAKGSPQHGKEEAHAWRAMLYNSLAGSRERVENILAFLACEPEVGVAAPPTPLFMREISQTLNHVPMRDILRRYAIELPRDAAIDFPVGGMFWARTAALRPLLELDLNFDNFTADTTMRDGTLAHTLERLIFWSAGIAGMKWVRLGLPASIQDCGKPE